MSKKTVKESNEMVLMKKQAEELLTKKFIDNFEDFIEQRKKDFHENLTEYLDETEQDKLSVGKIENYLCTPFLKSFTGTAPLYNAEKLLIASDFYWDSIAEIEESGVKFFPTLQQFCRMLGISINKFRSYRNNEDEAMRNVFDMVNDRFTGYYSQHFNSMGKKEYSDQMAIFTMRATHGMNDNTTPINIINNNNLTAPANVIDQLEAEIGSSIIIDNDEVEAQEVKVDKKRNKKS